MSINVSISVHPYRLPLVCPLNLAGEEVEERTGWLVELTTEDGKKGWGEIAPLSGMSPEAEMQAMEHWDAEQLDDQTITPSVRCGLDMAFFNLGDPSLLPASLRSLPPPRDEVHVNALLIGEIDSMIKQERAAVREGYRTIKVKVGRQNPVDEVQMLNTINRHSRDETKFRLDANRAWTPHDAEHYINVLSEMNVEYVEEPFDDPRKSLAWSQGTGVPVALDESLRRITPEELKSFAGIRAVVLKPMLLGGLVQSMRYIEAAREIGAYPVISSMLECGVGTVTLAKFAASVCDPDVAAGLDTYRWLDADVLTPRPAVHHGRFSSATWEWSRYRIQTDE